MFRHRAAHCALLLAVTAALTLPGLGSMSLWDIDEGLNAEAAREMLESGVAAWASRLTCSVLMSMTPASRPVFAPNMRRPSS